MVSFEEGVGPASFDAEEFGAFGDVAFGLFESLGEEGALDLFCGLFERQAWFLCERRVLADELEERGRGVHGEGE